MNLFENLSNEGLLISTLSANIIDTYITIKQIKPKFNLLLYKEKEGAITKRLSNLLARSEIHSEAILIYEDDFENTIGYIKDYIQKYSEDYIFYLFQNEIPKFFFKLFDFLNETNIKMLTWDNNAKITLLNGENISIPCERDIMFEEYLNCIGFRIFNHYGMDLPTDSGLIELQNYIADNIRELTIFFNLLAPQLGKTKKSDNQDQVTVTLKNVKQNNKVEKLIELLKSNKLIEQADIGNNIEISISNLGNFKKLSKNWYKEYIMRNLIECVPKSVLFVKNVTLAWVEIKLLPINLQDSLIDAILYDNNEICFVKIDYQLTKWNSSILMEEILKFSLLNKFLSAKTILCFPFTIPKEIRIMADAQGIYLFDANTLRNIQDFFKEKLHYNESV